MNIEFNYDKNGDIFVRDRLQELSLFLDKKIEQLKSVKTETANPMEEEDDWNAELYCFGNGAL